MKYDADEKLIKDALNTIHTPCYNIMREVQKEIRHSKGTVNIKRRISIALISFFMIIFSTGIAATISPSLNNLLAIVSPDIAKMLQPINVSYVENGIKMEVIAAMNDGEMTVIYISMQDLTGDRIDETLDLYDYSLTGAQSFSSQIVHYDKSTNTATLRIEANAGKNFNNKRVRFSISSFLSGKQEFSAIDTKIDLIGIERTRDAQSIPLDMNNIPGGGGPLFQELKEHGTVNVLQTDQMNISLPNIDFMSISNIGYIEDRLHIQTKWSESSIDDHGYFYFVDTAGESDEVYGSNIYFGINESGTTQYGREYVEYIFDVKNIDLSKVQLMGYFVSHANYTSGKWRTTFRLEPVVEEKKTITNIKFDSWLTNSVSVSPMGITLVGSGQGNEIDQIIMSASMTDGSIQTFDSRRVFREDNIIRAKFTSSLPLDISQLESISINGHVVKFD